MHVREKSLNKITDSNTVSRLVLIAFLEHLAGLDTLQADFLLYGWDDHDQAFFHKVVPGTGEYQDLLQYLTVVVGVSYYYCHSKYFY